MAVLETIRSFFIPSVLAEPEVIVPAPFTEYEIKPLTIEHLPEVLRLNIRCFRNGDNYTKHTFNYLLNEARTLSYRLVTRSDELVAFAFVMVNENNAAHLTTIGVAPEHRRRGLARRLLDHIEEALRIREVGTVMLEVRVSNVDAQQLYRLAGYMIVQRIAKYYNNGEDCFLMIKALI
ncbi:MAG: ribosomal protein S18-alanine N-acetyltransferase [Pyrinomonadaceae bacterium]